MSGFDRLEIGGNVFEIIEFTLDRKDEHGNIITGKYGVNVAKVREVVRLPKINSLASRVPSVAGLFELRGVPIPAIKLAEFLGDDFVQLKPDMQIIVTEFSGKRAGFIVNSTSRIRRLKWDDVQPVSAESGASLNGMTLIEDNEFLFIVDLERILATIENKMTGIREGASYESMLNASGMKPVTNDLGKNSRHVQDLPPLQRKANLLLIDDSKFILDGIAGVLGKLGYGIRLANDGAEGKAILEELAAGTLGGDPVDLVVTDVEMPKLDGLTLTKWIKEHPLLQNLPVIIHSSLSGDHNQKAGMSMGAQGYVVKNDIKKLDALITEILGTNFVPGSLIKNAS